MTKSIGLASIILSFILCAYAPERSESNRPGDETKDSVETLIKWAMEKDRLPSLSVAAAKDGKIVFQEAYGLIDVENNVRLD